MTMMTPGMTTGHASHGQHIINYEEKAQDGPAGAASRNIQQSGPSSGRMTASPPGSRYLHGRPINLTSFDS